VGRRRAIVSVALAGLLVAAGIAAYAGWRARESVTKTRRVMDILDKADRHAGAINDLLRTLPESHPKVEQQAKLAFEEIEKAMAIDPENADAYFLRGRIHSLRFEEDEARRCYDMAIRKGPVARAHLERALLDCQNLVILRAGGSGAASSRIDDLKKGIRGDLLAFKTLMYNPTELKFANALIEISKLNAQGFAAAAEGLKAYSEHTQDWRAYFWKGVAEIETEDFEEARKSLETALEFRGGARRAATILDRLGVAYSCLKEPKAAVEKFRLALGRDPAHFGAKVNLANQLLDMGEFEEAIRWCEEGLKQDPTSSLAHAIRGPALVLKHTKVKLDPDAGRALLQAAEESLEIAKRAYPAKSAQGEELQRSMDYVRRRLEY